MKILTWNCNGGFRNKVEAISSAPADLYIIQECEDPTTVKKSTVEYQQISQNHIWIGDNKNKGLGVFSGDSHLLNRLDWNLDFDQSQLKWFLPFSVDHRLNLVAVWAHRGCTGEFRYIGQFYKLLCNNPNKIAGNIFIGDFNSNKIWDYKRSEGDHSTCVRMLEEQGIYSVYHRLREESQGKETVPTFLLQRNKEKSYHIDYIFSSMSNIEKTKHFEVCNFDHWLQYSDHVPMLWEFEHAASGVSSWKN